MTPKLPGGDEASKGIMWLFHAAYDNNWLLYAICVCVVLVLFSKYMKFVIILACVGAGLMWAFKNYKFGGFVK